MPAKSFHEDPGGKPADAATLFLAGITQEERKHIVELFIIAEELTRIVAPRKHSPLLTLRRMFKEQSCVAEAKRGDLRVLRFETPAKGQSPWGHLMLVILHNGHEIAARKSPLAVGKAQFPMMGGDYNFSTDARTMEKATLVLRGMAKSVVAPR